MIFFYIYDKYIKIDYLLYKYKLTIYNGTKDIIYYIYITTEKYRNDLHSDDKIISILQGNFNYITDDCAYELLHEIIKNYQNNKNINHSNPCVLENINIDTYSLIIQHVL